MEAVGVKTPLGWTIVGHVSETANACSISTCIYTFHTTFTLEMSADELMRKMWHEDVVGITNENTPLTAEEVLAAGKVAESRYYAEGRYEVAIPWKDDEPPLHCNRTTAEDRLYSLEKHLQRRPDIAKKYCQVMEANKAKGYVRKMEPGEIDNTPLVQLMIVSTSFSGSKRRKTDYQSENSVRLSSQIRRSKP